MRILILAILLLPSYSIYAQDTIGSIKVKKVPIDKGSISGTYRMTFTRANGHTGKGTASRNNNDRVYTSYLLETGRYKIVQNNGTEWTGKWEHKDGIIRLYPTKKSMKKGSEILPQYCKEWKITDLTQKSMKIECAYKTKEGTDVMLDVNMVKIDL